MILITEYRAIRRAGRWARRRRAVPTFCYLLSVISVYAVSPTPPPPTEHGAGAILGAHRLPSPVRPFDPPVPRPSRVAWRPRRGTPENVPNPGISVARRPTFRLQFKRVGGSIANSLWQYSTGSRVARVA